MPSSTVSTTVNPTTAAAGGTNDVSSDGGVTSNMMGNIHWSDVVVIVIYFILIVCVGLWSMFRKNRGNVQGYFLAGRDMLWWPVGASLFASNIGSEHFIGVAGLGAASGLACAAFELNAVFILMVLGWVFVPVYLSSGVFTMPEYMKRRYGGQRLRLFLAVLALFMYIFTKISVDMYAGAIFIQQAIGIDIYLSIGSLLLVTTLYTIAGGLAAVIYTDFVQAVIMVIGALILMVMSFVRVNGYQGLLDAYPEAIPTETLVMLNAGNDTGCGIPRDDAFNMFRDPIDSDLPWPAILIGLPIMSIWYWCTDQVIVQRTLASKNMTHAKGGCIFAGWLKLLPLFMIVFPGMIARVLFPDEVACATPEACMAVCENEHGCSNIAYPKLVIELMPHGLRGLMLAVLLSALMSSLTSIFNSSSTLFTMDIWRRFRRRSTERELMVVGRLFVLVLMGVSILWIPIMQAAHGSELFIYIQKVQGYFSPPLASCFLWGVAWKRVNEKGAFWGLMVGIVMGSIRFLLELVIYGTPLCGEEDLRPAIVTKVNFIYFAIISFIVCSSVTIVVSLLTEPIPDRFLYRLTWATRHSTQIREDMDDDDDDIIEDRPPIEEAGEITESKTALTNGESQFQIEESYVKTPQGRCRTFYEWFCGYSTNDEAVSSAEKKEQKQRGINISEDSKWANIVNINSIIVVCVTIFIYGYFA